VVVVVSSSVVVVVVGEEDKSRNWGPQLLLHGGMCRCGRLPVFHVAVVAVNDATTELPMAHRYSNAAAMKQELFTILLVCNISETCAGAASCEVVQMR
jgi:hypothetical protein